MILLLTRAYALFMDAARLWATSLLFLLALIGCSSSGNHTPTPLPTTATDAPGASVSAPAVSQAPAPASGPYELDDELVRPAVQQPPTLDPALVPWRKALAEARTVQVQRLAAYRKAQKFPHNHIALNRIPIFIDSTGAHCAVAYLLRESGHGELADGIAQRDNFVRIEEVESGPLIDWIRLSGLLQEEAALIQPGYSWADAEGRERAEEIERLVGHFTQVEALLNKTSEDSLDLALERLAPMIAAGAKLDDVVR